MFSACLTVEGIPVKGEDGDDDVDGADEEDAGRDPPDATLDPTMPDGAVPERDAEIDSGEPGIPCFDRGNYNIDGLPVRGMRQTCDGDLVCVEGQCVPLPACTPGVTHECLYTPEGVRGAIVPFTQELDGEYLYWMEYGGVDKRANPLYDGALARAKVGEWVREEVATGLDLYSETNRAFHEPQLRIEDGYAAWSAQPDSHVAAGYVSLSETPFVVRQLVESRMWLWCWSNGVAYRANQDNLHRQTLDGSAPILVTNQLAGGAGCIASGETLVVRTSTDSGGDGYLYRLELSDPSVLTKLTPYQPIEAFDEHGYWTLLDNSWVGVAADDPAGSLTWRSVAGPIVNGDWKVVDSYVLWNRTRCNNYSRGKAVIMRTPIEGDGEQEVIAEISGEYACSIEQAAFDARGTVWNPSSSEWLQQSFHFAPMPPPAASPVLED